MLFAIRCPDSKDGVALLLGQQSDTIVAVSYPQPNSNMGATLLQHSAAASRLHATGETGAAVAPLCRWCWKNDTNGTAVRGRQWLAAAD